MYLNSVSVKCELLSRFDAQAKKLLRTGCTRGLEEGTPLNSTVGDLNSCTGKKKKKKEMSFSLFLLGLFSFFFCFVLVFVDWFIDF